MDKMFWEDTNQANERLQGTYVLHNNRVVYVERCDDRAEGPSARVLISRAGKQSWIPLADKGFNDFHKLPPLGYVNVFYYGEPRAVYLERMPERSRAHGLKNARVSVEDLGEAGFKPSRLDYSYIVSSDEGYEARLAGEYPTAKEIIANLTSGCSAAFSPVYAIVRDSFGTARLYRRRLLVGAITNDIVQFTRTTDCYREELAGIERFDIRVEG